jgi:hypothetical protein
VKVLTLDIETRPHIGMIFGLWDQNLGLSQILEWGSTVCFAAKWYGEKRVHFASDFHDGHEQMVRQARDLLNEADAVISFNGKSFDIKHLNREIWLAGVDPPSPHKDIDLLLVARNRFKFASNKLQHLADQCGIGAKVETGGIELWRKACLEQDPKAWAKMKRYNIHDVELTERLYDRMLPWIPNHPNRNLYRDDGEPLLCGTCGAPDSELTKRGFRVSQVARYRLFQCKRCKSYSTSRHREPAGQSYRKPI